MTSTLKSRGWRLEEKNSREENHMRAVLVDKGAPANLSLGELEEPTPSPSEALVRVSAISLNRGEVRRAQTAEDGFHPGWDLSGIVEKEAADGSGPRSGTRVVGFLPSGAWAELVAVPTNSLAELPEGVSFETAATLPVAGLTALYALEKGGGMIGRSVLVTGASGGAGHFAIQLARLSGAHVVALVRREENEDLVREAGAHEVAIGEDAESAGQFGPYHLVLESVGGKLLGGAMGMLVPGGTCVTFGSSGAAETTFDVRSFYLTGGARLYGFIIFHEVLAHPASGGLARLAGLVAEGKLRPHVSVEASWEEVGEVAQRLLARGYTGKAVLTVGS
jgi:NADPH:quinone reductase